MKQKYFKYILAIFIILFVSINSIKAETGDVTISTNSSDFISTTTNIGDRLWDTRAYEEYTANVYKYILFNGALTYGGESVAKSTCDKYCNSCQEYQRNPDEYAFYVCKIYNLKSSYFAVHSGRVPSVIREVNSTTFPKVNAKYKCRYVKYSDEWNISGQSGLTGAALYRWVCESEADCKNTCSGTCTRVGKLGGVATVANSDLLYTCFGRKLPNVFVTIDGKEVNADTLSAITDDDLKSWDAKTGDGIAAALKGVLMVLGEEITCEGALGDTIGLIRDIFTYVKIGAMILLIVLTAVDFIKSVTNGEEALKKATNTFIKRAIVVVVIFLLPTLINLILSIIQMKEGLCGL